VSSCDKCPIEEKIYVCCYRYPLTGETAVLRINGKEFIACPYLSSTGMCRIYENRPPGCMAHFCDRHEKHSFFRAEYGFFKSDF